MSDENLFESLTSHRQKAVKDKSVKQLIDKSVNQLAEESVKRRGRAKGKRSDPSYIQVGAYIPKDLDKAVKRKLLDEEMDFSELVARLLSDWVNQ